MEIEMLCCVREETTESAVAVTQPDWEVFTTFSPLSLFIVCEILIIKMISVPVINHDLRYKLWHAWIWGNWAWKVFEWDVWDGEWTLISVIYSLLMLDSVMETMTRV